MKNFILKRSKTRASLHLLDNPALGIKQIDVSKRSGDIVFCGNLGRFQHVPLLISSIKTYLNESGKLRFTFIGDGLFAMEVARLAKDYERVNYLGFLPPKQASTVVRNHRWALLPIHDEVTQLAFPSKSSSYVMAGCGILAICSSETSVGRWVKENNVGFSCQPTERKLVESFEFLEGPGQNAVFVNDEKCEKLKISVFVDQLMRLCELQK
jgi:glycosyltransferase involved in cell wall biosynthesis